MPIEELYYESGYDDDRHYEYPSIETITSKLNEIIRFLNEKVYYKD